MWCVCIGVVGVYGEHKQEQEQEAGSEAKREQAIHVCESIRRQTDRHGRCSGRSISAQRDNGGYSGTSPRHPFVHP